MNIKILLVDDHQMFRDALISLLKTIPGVEVVGAVGTGVDALSFASEKLPDIVCMDIGMAGENGIDITKKILEIIPSIKVIALSTYSDQGYVREMMQAGASAYVTKDESSEELQRAITAVSNNRLYLCSSITNVLTRAIFIQTTKKKNTPMLGRREQQVLQLVAVGKTSEQIARDLGIAKSTVNVHRRNIMRKLDLHNAVEITRYAVNSGLVSG